MINNALSWAAWHVDNLFLSHGCCCSADNRVDAQGVMRCTDFVVTSEWSADERCGVGYTGHMNDLQGRGADFPSPFGKPGGLVTTFVAEGEGGSQTGTLPSTPRVAGPTMAGKAHDSPRSPTAFSCGGFYPDRDPDEGSSEAAARESMALRELMKRFVQDMVQGQKFSVVIGDGKTELCKLVLTPNLLYLQLEAGGVLHDIPLRNVKDVCTGKLDAKMVPIELDELCNTIVLRNNECVTFRFPNLKERDDFTKCIKILALALDQ